MAKEGQLFLPPVNKKSLSLPNISYHGRRLSKKKIGVAGNIKELQSIDVRVGDPCDRAKQQTQSPCKCSPDPPEVNSKTPTNFSKLKISSGFHLWLNHHLISEWQMMSPLCHNAQLQNRNYGSYPRQQERTMPVLMRALA